MVNTFENTLTRKNMQDIHEATLRILKTTGLRVDCRDYYDSLESVGALVNRTTGVVKFPKRVIEATIEYLRGQIASGRRQYLLNGVTNPRWTPPLGCKFGGACIEYLDLDKDSVRPPTEQDLIKLLQLGEALEDVGFVGNPVACLVDNSGKKIPGPLQRIKTTALVAQYTTKCGSTEVWNEQELELLIEIGEIARGGKKEYEAQPCFITAKETIAPLQFPAEDGKILLILARRGLPCTIIPMPLTGGTSPCSVAGAIVIANAEILGVLACIHSAVPEAMCGGGVITGVIDMLRGSASFSAPEALLQDAGIAQLYDRFYGQDLAIGTGYTDAKYPGVQSCAEKTLKFVSAAGLGRFNFPVGLLAGGKRFSPEQAVLDIDIAESIRRFCKGIEISSDTLAVDVIEEVGIGKEFLSHMHTLEHFRKNIWTPALFDRRCTTTLQDEKARDMLAVARDKVHEIWARRDLYRIDEDKTRDIEKIVERAGNSLR
jgi:trimethylamine--corrinoid protein Co-methyltransferase